MKLQAIHECVGYLLTAAVTDQETLHLVDAFCAAERQFDAEGLRKSQAEGTEAVDERQQQHASRRPWTAAQFDQWLDELLSLDDELIRVCEDWRRGHATQDAVRLALARGTAHRQKLHTSNSG